MDCERDVTAWGGCATTGPAARRIIRWWQAGVTSGVAGKSVVDVVETADAVEWL